MEIVAFSFLKRSSCVNRLKAPVKGALKEKKRGLRTEMLGLNL